MMLGPELKARLELGLAARRKQLEAEIREKLSAAREATDSGAIDQLIESGAAAVAELAVVGGRPRRSAPPATLLTDSRQRPAECPTAP